MESLEKDHSYSEHPQQPEATTEEYDIQVLYSFKQSWNRGCWFCANKVLYDSRKDLLEVAGSSSAKSHAETAVITRRLRDRELLRKRKAEAEEKDTHQDQSKRARKGRGAGRGRSRRQAPEPQTEPQPGGSEEKQERTVIPLEEKAGTSLDPQLESSLDPQVESSLDPQVEYSVHPQVEASAPHVETEELYTPKEVAEASPTGPAIYPMVDLEQASRSEEPEMPVSVENDHLEQEFYPSL